VARDGHGCERLIAQAEINGDRFSDPHFPLHDRSQASLPQIKTHAARALYTALAQVTNGNRNAEQNAGMPPVEFIRTIRFDSSVNIDRHDSILPSPYAGCPLFLFSKKLTGHGHDLRSTRSPALAIGLGSQSLS
jgi:hypothetical protein